MTIDAILAERSGGKCELCEAAGELNAYLVPPNDDADFAVAVCSKCDEELTHTDSLDTNHWRCLNNTMWSESAPVQIMAYRVLKYLSTEGWAQDLAGQLYLEEENQKIADSVFSDDSSVVQIDSNGAKLEEGDTVTLIKDLNVKGANFTAKRGTVVRNIRLTEDPKHVEGKINGSMIVIVAAFTKKA